jgi:gas vesicle protein
MSDHDDFGAFLVGLVVGGVSGALAALLLAPQSGEDTRTIIKDKAIELRDEAATTVEETLEKAEKTANEAVKKAESILIDAKKRANEIAEKGQVALEEGKDKFSKTVKKAAKDVGEVKS